MAASVNESLWSRILDSSLKFSNILAMMKHYKMMFLMKQFLTNFSSLYFDFFLKQILESERKRLSQGIIQRQLCTGGL